MAHVLFLRLSCQGLCWHRVSCFHRRQRGKIYLLPPSHLTDEFSTVRPDVFFCGAYLADDGWLSRHIGIPTHGYPAYSYSANSSHPAYPPTHFTHPAHPRPTHSSHPTYTYPAHSSHPAYHHHAHTTPSLYPYPARSAHPADPSPAYSTHSAPSAHDLLSSSADIQGVPSWLSNTRMTSITMRWPSTTIEMLPELPEDILLEIFDFYRLEEEQSRSWHNPRDLREQEYPWGWHRLAHVCRKWRHVISMSSRRLDLRILCTGRAPIETILSSWPNLPLWVRYRDRKSKSLPNTVMIALRRLHRVCEIDLVLPSLLIGPIIEIIQEPLQALEYIQITAERATGPPMVVREALLGGSAPLLRQMTLDGIAFPFPSIRQVLLSTKNLVQLNLSNIPNDVYFSPDDLVTGLTTLVQLQQLAVGFLSPTSSPLASMTRPPQRTTLPSLTYLCFRGETEYLEEFVARVDLPALGGFYADLFNDVFFEIPQLCQFIPHLNQLRSSTSISIEHSRESVCLHFYQDNEAGFGECVLSILCERLDWQLSSVAQIASQLSPFLPSVDYLYINVDADAHFSAEERDVDASQWLELFRPFTHVTKVCVMNDLVPDIAQALAMENLVAGVLPELTLLRLLGYHSSPSAAKAAEQFIARRRCSGRTVHLTAKRFGR